MLYYAVRHLNADGGIMVTGSHNPAEYNGFKMVLGKSTIHGAEIQNLAKVAASGKFAQGRGALRQQPVLEDYAGRLVQGVRPGRYLRVGWDPGNGAASQALARLTELFPAEHHVINGLPDGDFPAHHPDPTMPENLAQLRELVAREKLDIGIAFDGDGDRIGVVDDKGRILWGDQLMVLYAREVLRDRPGATIIADVKASQVLFDEIARAGGKPLMWRTGHSLIKSKMAETGAPLAGEMSGHVFFADRYYGFDDALYAAVRLLVILAGQDKRLSELRDAIPSVVNTPELRFPCSETRKFAVVEEVRARLAAEGADVNATDGVRVTRPHGWWLLRASNTQDVLVARCEARDEKDLARLKEELAASLRASGVSPPGF
jgi:phosphomannomutase